MADDDPIMSAYSYAKRDGVKEGFVPVLLRADDETLWECLILNSDPDSDGEDNYAFDPGKVAEYREKMLAAPLQDGKAVLEGLVGQRKEEAEDDDMDWDEEILGEMEGGYDNCRFSSYTQYRGLTQVANWVKLKFAAMNLKKLARWLWKENSPSFLSRLFLLLYAGNPACSYR